MGQHPDADAAGGPAGARHVPVLLPRVARTPRSRLSRDRPAVLVDATLGLGGHARRPARRAPAADARRSRPRPRGARPRRPAARRLRRPHPPRARRVRPHRRRPGGPGASPGRRRAVRPRRVVAAARRRPSGASPTPATPTSTCGWTRTAGRRPPTSLNTYPVPELARVLREYGEERFASRIAAAIGRRRAQRPLRRSAELVELLYEARPGRVPAHRRPPGEADVPGAADRGQRRAGGPAAAVPAAIDALAVGGRIVVLAYQSLEDRIVKRELAERARSRTPEGLPVELPGHGPELRLLTRGAEIGERRRDRRQPARRLGAAARRRTDRGGRSVSTASRRSHSSQQRRAGRQHHRGGHMSAPVVERPRAGSTRTATAATRTATRPTVQPGRVRAPGRPRPQRDGNRARPATRTVARAVAPGRAQFVLTVMVLLGIGLVATLWLSTAAAADSYRLQDARGAARDLSERSERLHRDVAALQSPPALAQRATELGMVPAKDPGPAGRRRRRDDDGGGRAHARPSRRRSPPPRPGSAASPRRPPRQRRRPATSFAAAPQAVLAAAIAAVKPVGRGGGGRRGGEQAAEGDSPDATGGTARRRLDGDSSTHTDSDGTARPPGRPARTAATPHRADTASRRRHRRPTRGPVPGRTGRAPTSTDTAPREPLPMPTPTRRRGTGARSTGTAGHARAPRARATRTTTGTG